LILEFLEFLAIILGLHGSLCSLKSGNWLPSFLKWKKEMLAWKGKQNFVGPLKRLNVIVLAPTVWPVTRNNKDIQTPTDNNSNCPRSLCRNFLWKTYLRLAWLNLYTLFAELAGVLFFGEQCGEEWPTMVAKLASSTKRKQRPLEGRNNI
jgi:hypothetical protein